MDRDQMEMKNINEELSGSIDFDVIDVSEGQIVRLRDGTLIDPEIFISYFNDLSAFEEEFGPLEEAKEKLRELKKLEEEFGPVHEISEALSKVYERAEELLESYHDDDDERLDDLYEAPEEDEEEEEELDVSDLTVKQLLALLVTALLDDDDGADEDVDLEDLDLERIGDMTVGELLQLLREGKVKEVSEGKGCGCGDRKGKLTPLEEAVEKLFEEDGPASLEEAIEKLFEDEEGGELSGPPPLGLVEEPNKKDREEEEEEEKEEEGGEENVDSGSPTANAVEVKEESLSQPEPDIDIFKRLLERLR